MAERDRQQRESKAVLMQMLKTQQTESDVMVVVADECEHWLDDGGRLYPAQTLGYVSVRTKPDSPIALYVHKSKLSIAVDAERGEAAKSTLRGASVLEKGQGAKAAVYVEVPVSIVRREGVRPLVRAALTRKEGPPTASPAS